MKLKKKKSNMDQKFKTKERNRLAFKESPTYNVQETYSKIT